MRQRAMIAMALASPNPGLMIADEPTTALDVTIQAQILQLIEELKDPGGHGSAAHNSRHGSRGRNRRQGGVMYAGRKVEEGSVYDIFDAPSHPYTRGLLESLPSNPEYRGKSRLHTISGSVPDLLTVGRECPFVNRCREAVPECRVTFPGMTEVSGNHVLWCHAAKPAKVPS
jgi:peptide/nickel transport system ATP-binding protein